MVNKSAIGRQKRIKYIIADIYIAFPSVWPWECSGNLESGAACEFNEISLFVSNLWLPQYSLEPFVCIHKRLLCYKL